MERREYQRIRLNTEAVFVALDKDIAAREFEGHLKDISEGGFQILADYNVNPAIFDSIEKGDMLHFSIPAEYELFGEEISTLLTGKVRIVRKDTDEGTVNFGCMFICPDEVIEKYVHDQRMNLFIKGMKDLDID